MGPDLEPQTSEPQGVLEIDPSELTLAERLGPWAERLSPDRSRGFMLHMIGAVPCSEVGERQGCQSEKGCHHAADLYLTVVVEWLEVVGEGASTYRSLPSLPSLLRHFGFS